MRLQEVRQRYAAHRARRGETLLIMGPSAGAAGTEELYQSLWAAELAVAARLSAFGGDLWLYDGQRLYDAGAVRARIGLAIVASMPAERAGAERAAARTGPPRHCAGAARYGCLLVLWEEVTKISRGIVATLARAIVRPPGPRGTRSDPREEVMPMKKPYTRPTLVTHGTVGTLTGFIGGTAGDGIAGSGTLPPPP
ncbi:MAG TPA: hypothetical protein VIL85_01620 [Thermomicrobiales bacterium]